MKIDFQINGRSVPLDRMADEMKKEAFAKVEKDLIAKVRHAAFGKGHLEVKVERDSQGLFKSLILKGDEAAVEAAKKAMA